MKLKAIKHEGLDSALVEIEVSGGNAIKEIDKAIDMYNFMYKRLKEINHYDVHDAHAEPESRLVS